MSSLALPPSNDECSASMTTVTMEVKIDLPYLRACEYAWFVLTIPIRPARIRRQLFIFNPILLTIRVRSEDSMETPARLSFPAVYREIASNVKIYRWFTDDPSLPHSNNEKCTRTGSAQNPATGCTDAPAVISLSRMIYEFTWESDAYFPLPTLSLSDTSLSCRIKTPRVSAIDDRSRNKSLF